MLKNKLKQIWDENKASINGWISIPNSFTAEAMSKMGWDSLTVDLQHGLNSYETSIPIIQSISHNTIPLARVPWNDPGIIMKMLDLGVLGIIAPMINNKKDCEKFVSYCRYPPLGQRSFGPIQAQLKYGGEYFEKANENIICIAMIETKEAVKNLDEILSVPTLDGVYIGPADMSISYGLKPKFDITEDPIIENINLIVKKAKEYKKIAGIHNGTTAYAKKMIDLGYKFVTVSSDFRSMSNHSQSIIDEMKNVKKNTEEKAY